MRHPIPLIAGALMLALAGTGCDGPSDDTPVACLEGASVYRAALRHAPGEVRLNGETPIGDCLAENQTGGDLATVGAAMVEATTRLNAEARESPGGGANLQLGYLLGAAERGADETGGIHADLIRRLESAALYSPGDQPPPPAFLRAYGDGLDVGKTEG